MVITKKTLASSRGFTLIELLVVIAIIAILAAVILASLGTARTKGADAALKSNLSNSRVQAELFYQANANTYYGAIASAQVCDSTASAGGVTGIYSFLAQAQKAFSPNGAGVPVTANGTPASWNTGACHASPTAWAMAVPLNASTAASPLYWCVDSTGYGNTNTVGLAANYYSCN